MTQLQALAKPFPKSFIHANPSGGGRGEYVEHGSVTQRLLAAVGGYDYELVEIIRGIVKGKEDLGTVVVGAICRLTLDIDGRSCRYEEIGDCELPGNWPHDGARLKDAFSDAIKRCAMRAGVGLHLWAQDEFFLDRALAAQSEGGAGTGDAPGAESGVVNNPTGTAERVVTSPPRPVPPIPNGGKTK